MENTMRGLVFFLALCSLAGCSEPVENRAQVDHSYSGAIERAKLRSDAINARDEVRYPYGRDLNIAALTDDQRKRLCGESHQKIANGWPEQKALLCNWPLRLVNETSAFGTTSRMYQRCEGASCLTIVTVDEIVQSWTAL